MLTKIKALLQDEQLRQEIKEAETQEEGIKLLTTAAAKKGDNFTAEDVTQILTTLAVQQLDELSEEDILTIAGHTGLQQFLTVGTKSWCSCN